MPPVTAFDNRLDEACAWAARLSTDDADFGAFAAWLEAHPANVQAYDAVSRLEGEVEARSEDIRRAVPANDGAPIRTRHWFGVASVAATALMALVALPLIRTTTAGQAAVSSVLYATPSGAGRTVQLTSGIRVRLDGRSSIRVADGARRIELAGGAAYFDVRHDPARPLIVVANGYEIRDIGTEFDVASTARHLSVSVAVGRVDVVPDNGAAPIPVVAGQRLDIEPAAHRAERVSVAAADVASWRSGQLRYQDAPLALVAADVSRYSGQRVTVDPRAADLRLSGVIEIGDGSRLVTRLQQLLPVETRMAGSETRLVPRGAR